MAAFAGKGRHGVTADVTTEVAAVTTEGAADVGTEVAAEVRMDHDTAMKPLTAYRPERQTTYCL